MSAAHVITVVKQRH